MARKRKGYDDDDGRTVADMSGVFPQRMWMPGRPPGSGTDRRAQKAGRQEADGEEMTGRERRWYVLGALKAALLIAAVFLVAFGLLIALLIAVWR